MPAHANPRPSASSPERVGPMQLVGSLKSPLRGQRLAPSPAHPGG